MNITAILFKQHKTVEQATTPEQAPTPFFRFLWQEKTNRLFLFIALLGTILQFVIFKRYYPYPDFFSDSYSYLFAANANLDVSIWPIGYSKFLRWFHYITYSSTALTAFQYFFVEIGAAYFFFTFLYLFRPGKITSIVIFIFLFFNPLFLYICNYVNSDPLFAALSLFWFTQLLWIIHKPRLHQLFIQATLLFLCFTVRNNAYYYPIIAAIAFLLSRQTWQFKLAGILLPFVLILPFVIHTRNAAYKMTGHKMYSFFTGWQLANNALYMRGHIEVDSNQFTSKEVRQLNALAEQYFYKRSPEFDDFLAAHGGNWYIQYFNAPLKQFVTLNFKPKDELTSIVAWGKASVVFEEYGSYLIKHYPLPYFRHFVWKNLKNYCWPSLEKLQVYNLDTNVVEPIAQTWFHFKSPTITVTSKNAQGDILNLYPLLLCIINFFLVINLYSCFTDRGFRQSGRTPFLVLVGSFWVLNLLFSVLVTITVFRYQFVPMILSFSFTILLMELLNRKASKTSSMPVYAKQ